jgi:hypothetical protein
MPADDFAPLAQCEEGELGALLALPADCARRRELAPRSIAASPTVITASGARTRAGTHEPHERRIDGRHDQRACVPWDPRCWTGPGRVDRGRERGAGP